ncbi:hypothetical protein RHM58_21900 [Pseudomonas sp. 10S4]|uniref:beta strand repeat-containing protein n=1 Tax=Pseudomonas sp. 10S4 TaxID=3048583 RepID=UPI002AC97E3A|nr:hypothetical protein [Pseudomonas sp. 10S4]WPX16645.1 hypothetical protein RHM58_21900 [Pseudomonas sp. 10S4]
MSEITTLDALAKLIGGQMIGGAASSADAANEIIATTDTKETDFGKIADSIVASSDLAGIAAGNIQMFQQFLSASSEAGALAAGLATRAGAIGVVANILAMGDTALERGYDKIKTGTIVSTVGGVLLTAGTVALAPEAVIALGILGAGLTIAGLTNLGTVGSNEAWLASAYSSMADTIKPYYDSLSIDEQTSFQSALTNAVQSTLNGGMLVPTIDSDGQIDGYSMQAPTSVVQQDNGSTVSYFDGGIGVVSPAPGDTSSGLVWTIPQPGSENSVEISTYKDGSYTYNSVDQSQTKISIDSNTANTATASAQNEEMIQTSSNGSVSATLGGTGATANLNNANEVLIDGASATITGSNNNVNAGADSQTTINGSSNNITGDTGATVDLANGSDWDVVTMMKNGEVIIADADTGITINASDSTVAIGTYASVSINGSTDVVTGGNGDNVTTQGTGQNITLGTGSTLVMTGTDEEASLSNGTVWLGANTTLTGSGLTGSNDVLNVSQNDSVVENGKDDTVNLSSGDSLVSNGGGNNIINAGVDDTVVIDSITAGYTDTVNATGDQSITLGNDVSVDVVGSGNTIFVAGTGDVLTDSGDTIASSNASLTIMNTSGTADLISGSNDTITANHSSISFSGMDEVLSGVYDTVGLETGSSLTLSLYDDTLNLSSGASVVISGGVGSGNVINAGVDDIVDIDSMTAGYTDTVNATGDQSITLGNDVSVDVVGGGNTIFVAGTGDVLADSGDTIASSNVSLTIMNTSGAADLISGDGDTITANHSSISFGGVGEVLSGVYDTVGLETGSSLTLSLYDDTLNLSSGASVFISGGVGSGNIINAGVDDIVDIDSMTAGYTDTVNATGDQSITLGSDVSVDVVGSGNTITANGGDSVSANGDTILIAGIGNSLAGAGDTISSSNISLTIMNTSGAADLISGDGDTITASHSSIMLSGVGEVMSGSYDTIVVNTGSSVTLTNYDDTINLSSGASLVTSGGGQHYQCRCGFHRVYRQYHNRC